MPFAYFGAKHKLAGKYPRPAYDQIVEPFAGAAGYSCHWADLGKRVLLNDANADVVALWQRLQVMTAEQVLSVAERLDDARTDDLLLAGCAGPTHWETLTKYPESKTVAVTPRMKRDLPNVLARIVRKLPAVRGWSVQHGDYRDLPDLEATWFIDPPYQPLVSRAGNGYINGASDIDYEELSDWCQSRRGQVIVCEQSPAAWLPFTHLAHQANGVGHSRSEMVWTTDYQQQQLWPAE